MIMLYNGFPPSVSVLFFHFVLIDAKTKLEITSLFYMVAICLGWILGENIVKDW